MGFCSHFFLSKCPSCTSGFQLDVAMGCQESCSSALPQKTVCCKPIRPSPLPSVLCPKDKAVGLNVAVPFSSALALCIENITVAVWEWHSVGPVPWSPQAEEPLQHGADPNVWPPAPVPSLPPQPCGWEALLSPIISTHPQSTTIRMAVKHDALGRAE